MVKQLLHPAEIETYYILPTLRSQLAKFMKASGLQQKQIATIMRIQEATVSQYISDKRGRSFNFNQEMLIEIKKSAILIKDDISLLREINRLLQLARTTNTLCDVHRLYSTVPDNCKPEEIGCHEYQNNNVPNAKIRY